MAVRTVATTDTLEIFRTTFNSLSSTDIGDLASLNTTTKSSVIAAINEVEASVAGGFTLRDSTSTTQAIEGGATLNVVGSSNEVTAVVSATDVRIVAKEQVESLGGKFLSVEGVENLETSGGYAKEASEDFKKKQAELLKNAVKKNDIIICTALIPGKKAPRIISEEMVQSMKPGSIIYDLAVNQGGNSAFSEPDKVNIVKGVKIMGAQNILNKLALTASSLYAKNLSAFVNNLYNKEKKEVYVNLEDEIIKKTLINKKL